MKQAKLRSILQVFSLLLILLCFQKQFQLYVQYNVKDDVILKCVIKACWICSVLYNTEIKGEQH